MAALTRSSSICLWTQTIQILKEKTDKFRKCKPPQGVGTSNSFDEPSQILVVESNENAATGDQINRDISDIASVLHQPLIEGQETSSFHIEHLAINLPEAQQTSDNSTRTTPQATQQPTTTTAVTETENEAQVANMERVALLVIPISAGSIVSVTTGLFANQKTDLTQKILFKAYTLLNYIALMAAILLLLLITLKRSNIPRLVTIVQLTMWLMVGSITYALSCAISIILANGLVETILILFVPLLLCFFLMFLSSGRRKN